LPGVADASCTEWAPSRLGAAVDGLSDAVIAALAVWTVLCWIVTTAGAPLEPFTVGWLVVTAGLVVAWTRRPVRSPQPQPESPGSPQAQAPPTPPAVPGWTRPRRALLLATASAATVAALLAARESGTGFNVAWAFAAVSLVGVSWLVVIRRVSVTVTTALWAQRRAALGSEVIAAVAGLACAGLSLFVLRIDDDDVYYINRAEWIAQFNRIPHRDVLLSNGAYPAVGGTGSPVESFTSLQGGLAGLFGVHAASVAYLILPPIFAFLSVWALWRLLRSWALNRPIVCLLVALGFLFVNTASLDAYGFFFFPRFSLGKGIFVSLAVPTLFLLMTRWARYHRRRDGWLVVAVAVAGIGLTTTAAFIVPLILIAGAVPLVIQRRWRALTPFVAGIVIVLVAGYVGSRFAPPAGFQLRNFRPPDINYHDFLGVGVVAAIAGLGLWLGVWLVRDRTAQLIVLGSAVIIAIVLAPHVTHALSGGVGVAGALKRLMWVAPVPALVGLLAGLPPAMSRRWLGMPARFLATGVTGALAVGLIVAGNSGGTIVSHGPQRLVDHPTWKAPMGDVKRAEQVIGPLPPGSEVLAPLWVMHAVALVTGSIKAVNPRPLYSAIIPQPKDVARARNQLTRFITDARDNGLTPPSLSEALRLDRVSDVCFAPGQQLQRAELARLGWGRSYAAGRLTCLQQPASTLGGS
jgi:hypothetical protein